MPYPMLIAISCSSSAHTMWRVWLAEYSIERAKCKSKAMLQASKKKPNKKPMRKHGPALITEF